MKYLIIVLTLVIITSCNQVEKRGYAFDLSDYGRLKEQISNKNDVLSFMGYPSFTSEVGDNELWVYYSEDVQKFLFFQKKTLDRQIATISFNDQDIIRKIDNYSLSDQNSVAISKKFTEVKNQKKSWWSQIFSNIGQVRAN
ncbi:MAG: outer membrane protein assembly factor BamE (lipoprotein component of BamABCDE complex) [Rickettsiales bacterium]|jgi:outer membrane protein assembly factor BamE (lipoprotein component of BamABCDE complex)